MMEKAREYSFSATITSEDSAANTSTSEDWKLGTFRLDIPPGGRR